jgi:hypothetical protein
LLRSVPTFTTARSSLSRNGRAFVILKRLVIRFGRRFLRQYGVKPNDRQFTRSPAVFRQRPARIDQTSFDLSVKNPNKAEDVALRDPQDIIAEMAALDAESAEILEGIRGML